MRATEVERRERTTEKPIKRTELTRQYASIGIPAVAAAAPYAKVEKREAPTTPPNSFDLRFEAAS
ncbi:MAG: hypothetical protein AB7O60_08035 [Variibacter sp.]